MKDPIQGSSASLRAFENNADFRCYARQMMAAGRDFSLTKQNSKIGKTKYLITADDPRTRNIWMDCCFSDYIQQKKSLGNGHRNFKWIYIQTFFIVIIVATLLTFVWPIWSFLIDVDAKPYYRVLDLEYGADASAVAKAYRKQMKRWHPDLNPNCGVYCRTQTKEIQQAYEVLLERKGHRFYLDNQYLDRLLELRSLVFFRMHSLSSNAAQEICNLLFHMRGIKYGDDRRPTLTLVCYLSTIILFISHEIFFGSGFAIVLLFQALVSVVRGIRSSAREMAQINSKLSAYVDIFREAFWMVLPLVLLNLFYIASNVHSLDFMKELSRTVLGSLYIFAYLNKFTPNVYNNLKEKTCKVSFCYRNQGGRSASEFALFVQAELTFWADDLFIFSCLTPSIYRIAVLASHTLYLLQYFFFPREFSDLEADGHQGGDETKKNIDSQRVMPTDQEAVAPQELTEMDAKLLLDLDQEPTSWLDIPRFKYNSVILMMITKLVERDVNNFIVDFTCTSDMKNIAFFVLDKKTHLADGMFFIPDPPMARLVGLECDLFQTIPCTSKEKLDKKYLKESCLRNLGSEANLTASEVWRRRENIPGIGTPVPQSTFQNVFFLVLSSLLALAAQFLIIISPTSA